MSNECRNRGRFERATRSVPWVVAFSASALLITHHPPLATAQTKAKADEPTEHYYRAEGRKVQVAWAVEPETVPEGGELTATLVVTGATNPRQIVRPNLKALDAFQSRFAITDNADPKPTADAKEVRFSYRLRPRTRAVDRVPTFIFRYFKPDAPVGPKQYPEELARSVPIAVTDPPPRPPAPVVPLGEPDYLFAVATGPGVLARPGFAPGRWAWAVVALAGPLAALGWYVGWRRVFPGAARLARIRRTRAARRAADAIRRADRTPDPPAALAAAVLGYLRARFPLPPGAVTPAEVGTALRALGVPPADAGAAVGFFRTCDAARFAPENDTPASLSAEAAGLVARLEAA